MKKNSNKKEKKKSVIDVDFANKHRLIKRGTCPHCGEAGDFEVNITGNWILSYIEKDIKLLVIIDPAMINIKHVKCLSCLKKIKDEDFLNKIENDVCEVTTNVKDIWDSDFDEEGLELD